MDVACPSAGMRSEHCCSVLHVFVFTTAEGGGRFLLRHGIQNTIHTIIIKLSARRFPIPSPSLSVKALAKNCPMFPHYIYLHSLKHSRS